MPHKLPALTVAIERRRAGAFVLGLVVMLFAACFVAFESAFVRSIFDVRHELGAERWLMRIFAVALSCMASAAFHELAEQGPPEHWPLVRMLRERPSEIVWVYAKALSPPGSRDHVRIVACTDAGASVDALIADRFTLRVLRDAAEAAPHATVGRFAQELEDRWRRDPASLRTREADAPPQLPATYRGDDREPAVVATRAPVPDKPRHLGAPGYVVLAIVTSAIVLATPSLIDAAFWRPPPVRDTPILYGPQ